VGKKLLHSWPSALIKKINGTWKHGGSWKGFIVIELVFGGPRKHDGTLC